MVCGVVLAVKEEKCCVNNSSTHIFLIFQPVDQAVGPTELRPVAVELVALSDVPAKLG